MFLRGLRGAYGLKLAIWLLSIWNVYFFVTLLAGMVWLSWLLLGLSISANCYASSPLCKHREDLRFGNKFAKEHAFHSSAKNAGEFQYGFYVPYSIIARRFCGYVVRASTRLEHAPCGLLSR